MISIFAPPYIETGKLKIVNSGDGVVSIPGFRNWLKLMHWQCSNPRINKPS